MVMMMARARVVAENREEEIGEEENIGEGQEDEQVAKVDIKAVWEKVAKEKEGKEGKEGKAR